MAYLKKTNTFVVTKWGKVCESLVPVDSSFLDDVSSTFSTKTNHHQSSANENAEQRRYNINISEELAVEFQYLGLAILKLNQVDTKGLEGLMKISSLMEPELFKATVSSMMSSSSAFKEAAAAKESQNLIAALITVDANVLAKLIILEEQSTKPKPNSNLSDSKPNPKPLIVQQEEELKQQPPPQQQPVDANKALLLSEVPQYLQKYWNDPNLQTLNLERNSIGDKGAEWLSKNTSWPKSINIYHH